MTDIRVETVLDAPPDVVWADVRTIATHADWMHDAESITFTSDHHEGLGATFDVATKVGPIRLTDRMEITEWIDEEVMGVRHVGVVTGVGRFTLTPFGTDKTRFVWAETLTFPWWLGGPLGGLVGGQILKLIWKRNLKGLAARFA